ncbi:tripartite motif-containing protein 43-like [Ictidomys tridecemlineatus]
MDPAVSGQSRMWQLREMFLLPKRLKHCFFANPIPGISESRLQNTALPSLVSMFVSRVPISFTAIFWILSARGTCLEAHSLDGLVTADGAFFGHHSLMAEQPFSPPFFVGAILPVPKLERKSTRDYKEHGAHRHCPIEEAAEQYREKFLKLMRSLWKKIQENQRNLKEESRKINQWVWYVHLHRENTKAAYRMLHPSVHEEEKEHLEILLKERKLTIQKIKKRKAKMLQKGKQLKKDYQELMKMCHKPYVELFENLEDTLAEYELVFLHMPQPVRPQLSAQPITGLRDELNHFQGGCQSV